MSGNILARHYLYNSQGDNSGLTLRQLQMDGLLGSFVDSASDVKNMTAMLAGGVAYRFGKIAFLESLPGKLQILSKVAPSLALAAEVTTFRLFQASPKENVSDSSGWKSWFTDYVHFATLKSFGKISAEQNLVFGFFTQSTAMVAGHQLAYSLDLVSKPEGNLFEQYVNASVMNAQMWVSMGLLKILGVESLQQLEKKWELESNAMQRLGEGEISIFKDSEILLNLAVGPSHVYWYPTGHEGKRIPRVLYPGELESKITALEKELREKGKALSKIKSSEAFKKHRVDENLVNEIWFHQARHFAESVGGTCHIFPLSRLSENVGRLEGKRPHWPVQQALAALRSDKIDGAFHHVLEIEIPFEEVNMGLANRTQMNTTLSHLFYAIQEDLRGMVALVGLVGKEQDRLLIRVPSLSAFERIFKAIHGREAPQFHYVEGEIPQEIVMNMRAMGVAPIGVTRNPLRLGDIDVKVHPWFFAFHDVYHAAILTEYSSSFRLYLQWLYRNIQASPLARSQHSREHLDRLVDMDSPGSRDKSKDNTFFAYTLSYLRNRRTFKSVDQSPLVVSHVLHNHGFLNRYLAFLNEKKPESAEWQAFHEDLTSEVQNLLAFYRQKLQAMVGQFYGN